MPLDGGEDDSQHSVRLATKWYNKMKFQENVLLHLHWIMHVWNFELRI